MLANKIPINFLENNTFSPRTGLVNNTVKNGVNPNISAIKPDEIYSAEKYTNAILGNMAIDPAK